jgi:4-amino-4-deoxy-L-arabinose transferase-like glycosyltransferase
VYFIGSKLFDKKVGLLSAVFYAFSYEQSQYALLMSHQPLAVLTVLILYLGLAIFLFEKKAEGIIFVLLGLGLSIQFHFVYILLIPVVFGIILLLRKHIPKLKLKYVISSAVLFLLTISTYIISELKFNFGLFSGIFSVSKNSQLHIKEALYAGNRFIHNTFISNYEFTGYIFILILIIFAYLIFKPKLREKGIFLFLWFIGGILPYLISGTQGYYYSAAASVSLLILFSFLISRVFLKFRIVGIALCLLVIFNNYLLIKYQNPKGPNLEIVYNLECYFTKRKKPLILYIKIGVMDRFPSKHYLYL